MGPLKSLLLNPIMGSSWNRSRWYFGYGSWKKGTNVMIMAVNSSITRN